jgi:exopolysaccharide biosynthesis polyprenyl glycosylphosphotransferase
MNEKRPRLQIAKYLTCDYIAALVAWILFFIYRKKIVLSDITNFEIIMAAEPSMILGIIFIPIFWILLYYIAGEYDNVYRKSRLKELGSTALISILGVVIIFFALILDDDIITYRNYYGSILYLLGCHFSLTYTFRLFITNATARQIQNREIGFSTVIIGSGEQALKLYNDVVSKPKSAGEHFVGYITVSGTGESPLAPCLPCLGTLDTIINVLNDNKIEDAIIAIEPDEKQYIQSIVVKVKSTAVGVRAVPDILDIISGNVKMASIFGVPLIEMSHDTMPAWQANIKRLIDITVSAIAICLLIPLYLILAVCVKCSSKGPIFYLQERIGRYAKPFKIIKFRTMYVGAEKNGPELSSDGDPRITRIGRFMRKVRLDELPQFVNVLKGDMSLVGPRPERAFYIEQIVQKAPHYYSVFKVRPGITSWGQVKYGYAENVDEMVDRLKYDIIYLENMSLYLDIKILIYTIKTVLEGSGK